MAKFEKQLMKNLGEYQDAGIIDAPARKRFEDYLNLKIEHGEKSTGVSLLYVLYTLGISIVALGVILIIAYNWTDFSKPMRLFFGFVPLLLSGALGIWYFLTKSVRSAYWREIIPLLNNTGIITSIAVVSQVYHIEGDFQGFMRTVIILSALLPFIFNSGISAGINTVLVLTAFVEKSGPTDQLASVLYLAVLGGFLLYGVIRGERNPLKSFALIVWAIILPVQFLIFTDAWRNDYCGLYLLFFPVFLGFLLSSLSLASEASRKYALPTIVIAGAASFVMLLVLSCEPSVLSTGGYFPGEIIENYELHQWLIFGIVALLGLAYCFFFAKSAISGHSDKAALAMSGIGFVVVILFALENVFRVSDPVSYAAYLCVNLFAVVMPVAFMYKGVKSFSMSYSNIGALMLAAFIFTKFLSPEFTMLTRGVAFIFLGVFIIVLNGFLLARKKERAS